MPNSHGAPDPFASSLNRRDACQACANVSAVRSRLAVSVACVPHEPRADPDRVAVIELPECLWILAGRFEQLGVSSGHAVRRLSRRFVATHHEHRGLGACLKRVRRRNYVLRATRLQAGSRPQSRALDGRGRRGRRGSRARAAPARLRAVKLERPDLVVEARVAVLKRQRTGGGGTPAERASRRPIAAPARVKPKFTLAALLRAERVAERRAGRLPDARLHAAALREADLGQVRVVHVAGEHDDRARRLAAAAGADLAQQLAHEVERVAERRPVLEVHALAQLLAELRRERRPTRRRTPPRSMPPGSAAPARGTAAATCRSAGGRSRRSRAR